MDEFGNPLRLQDFIDDPNFGQFIDLIRGENEDPVASFDCDLINGCFADTQFGSAQENVFDFNGGAVSTMVSDDLSFVLYSSLPNLNGDMKEEHHEEQNDGNDSSGKTTRTTTITSARIKVDGSRALISEQKRRGKMKEKLYAWRALVPHVTKLDKASIAGDAVSYVQEQQIQAKKHKAEIAGLEASLAGSERYQESIEKPKRTQVLRSSTPICRKIMQVHTIMNSPKRKMTL